MSGIDSHRPTAQSTIDRGNFDLLRHLALFLRLGLSSAWAWTATKADEVSEARRCIAIKSQLHVVPLPAETSR